MLIYLFNKNILTTFCVPGTIDDSGNIVLSKRENKLIFQTLNKCNTWCASGIC